jgi:Kdo2-lipid IVA lauroyltransferase/acyltransferase
MKQFFWALQMALFYSLTLIAACLPLCLTHRLGGWAGLLIPRIVPKRRAIALANIDRALPFMKAHPLWVSGDLDAARICRGTFENMGRCLMEISQLYHYRGKKLIAGVEVRGQEHFEAARAKGKGVLCFTGHCGNWEIMALAFGSLFGAGVVLARRQDNPYLNEMVARMRMRYNSRVIYKQGALRGILTALKKGTLVGLLADQAVVPEEGALIEMMGLKAWASKAPVIIANKSGAPLLPVFIHREGVRQIITFYPEHVFSGDQSEEGVRLDTQALSRYVENFVVAHPTQWYWVHRRWKRAGESPS